jgi:hypothetical protein
VLWDRDGARSTTMRARGRCEVKGIVGSGGMITLQDQGWCGVNDVMGLRISWA